MGGGTALCISCRKRRPAKRLPYGAKRVRAWCDNCDKDFTVVQPNKKVERQNVRRRIRKEEI